MALRATGGDTAGEVVYFIRGGDAVKIGRTVNVAARLRALATASAVPLELLADVPGGRELEAQLHRGWQHLHIRGEWFEADEELLRFIREQAGGGPAGAGAGGAAGAGAGGAGPRRRKIRWDFVASTRAFMMPPGRERSPH
jgi:hypothetical protein